jgi:DegV family protein with EDD domain
MAIHKVALITDSTNDLPEELIKRNNIMVVPLTIVWDDHTYLDGVDMCAEDFYKRLEIDPSIPTTSQPAPGDFLKTYQAAKQAGAEEIIVITISSAMSGTFESARTAAKSIDIPVHVVDSKSNSMSIGWQLLACARVRENGGELQAMLAAAEKVRANLHYHIVLDTLVYLFKGGRIAGAAKLVNSVLKIKPQIRVNHNSGTVEPGDISRTRAKAIDALYSGFFKKLDLLKPMRIAVLHNNALEDAQALAERIRLEYHPVELIIGIVSPVLGVHTGPRAIALCGYSEP